MTEQEKQELDRIVNNCSGNQSDAGPNKARAELQAFVMKQVTTSLDRLSTALDGSSSATKDYNSKMVFLTWALIAATIVAPALSILLPIFFKQ